MYSAGSEPSVFKLFWEAKTIMKIFQQSLKIQYKFALLPPSKYTKTLIYKRLGIQMKQLRPLKVFTVSKVKTWENSGGSHSIFFSVGYLANENPSELRGF